ncbi:2-phospho-L-lactate transferase [Noviherbaspirillum sedimenti]|uniref:2-phospho-L-lactate transferase n=1 Tax=Noviherbaspirillum sedimenti TaxID=2320865 RepID=A0A3A3G8J7_9BURK|nr:2-phospho-L-lactate transferase [Noviherbaspirillum sedimenti]RJG03079.1 2-phospho-L-lactate transferase [Noviherbaspirillum sedimenti]
MSFKWIALSGGVGGAKLALGLAHELDPGDLLVVANTGDDFDHLGLRICPDLDTLMYTLAGCSNSTQGWGLEGETWACMEALGRLGGETWFRLGDRDLATHLYRSDRLRHGATLSQVTHELSSVLGVRHHIVPMSEARVATVVITDEGELSFQDYFVARQCAPRVRGVRFEGAENAHMCETLRLALEDDALRGVIICPSNPFLSVEPILAIPGVREALATIKAPIVAVSPIVGGQAIKGPTAKMMRELGMDVSPLGVTEFLRTTIDRIVIDLADSSLLPSIRNLGIEATSAPTVMRSLDDKRSLARAVLEFSGA